MRHFGISLRTGIVIVFLLVVGTLSNAAGAQFSAQGLCAGTSSNVSISSVSHDSCGNVVSADGSWDVSGGASGVQLDYYIDSTLYQSETKTGVTWGNWGFDDNFSSTGSHTFLVYAYPIVDNGSGYTTCLQHGSSASRAFTVSAAGAPTATIDVCLWNCDFFSGDCTGTCSGSATGGCPGYTPYWDTGSGFSLGTYMSRSISCNFLTTNFHVRFKVKDQNGNFSNIAEWPCGMD